MRALVDQLDLSKHEYLIVSSGAIASGMSNLGLNDKPTAVPLMQACAAVGQSVLMHTYEQLFFGKKLVAQLLLSSDDFTSPVRYKNLQNTMHELLKLGVVPVVNENDSVSVRELEGAFGDNDELSALLATAVRADWLMLLTDVDGFYVPNGKGSRLVRTIRKLTPAMEAGCNGHGKLGRGGMRSKLRAAKVASEAGVHVAIVNGRHAQAIPWAMEGKIGDVSVLLQSGKDRQAMETITRFADLIAAVLAVLPRTAGGGEAAALFAELNPRLREILDAFDAKDFILIGDILEYEIAPRLGGLAALLARCA